MGRAGSEVESLFTVLPRKQIDWLGELPPEEVPAILSQGDLYVWPGFGEAYGLAYLEAQASGLPVVAQAVAGVPEVVRNGETGLLTQPGDMPAYADAVRHLLVDGHLRETMGAQARRFVLEREVVARRCCHAEIPALEVRRMNADRIWRPLKNALERWRAAGRRPDFWLRDDDAVAPTPALERLLGLTEQFEVPLMLAVIPAHAGGELAGAIAGRPTVTPVVHGWSHENHAPPARRSRNSACIGRLRLSWRTGAWVRESIAACLANAWRRCSCRHGTASTPH